MMRSSSCSVTIPVDNDLYTSTPTSSANARARAPIFVTSDLGTVSPHSAATRSCLGL